MSPALSYHVIIAAAGEGTRFGGGVPKQYAPLAGKPVLVHSVDFFRGQTTPPISITTVIAPSHRKLHYDNILHLYDLPAPAEGGMTRKESIFNALQSITDAKDEDIVVIHDAARPNVSCKTFHELITAMKDCDAATLALPVSDTLRREEKIVERSGLWALQTPQAFRYGILKKAHETIKGDFTDDTGLVSALGVPVKLLTGSRANIKITLPEDLQILEKLMTSNEFRTGMGYDVHAFSRHKMRRLVLCGVEIDHAFGLEGHSDADVALHALTDAVLGAIGENDIGHHFPPSDEKFRNMDSRIFLEKACALVAQKGGTIQNADITLICESPKISSYRDQMKNKVAEILNIDPSRVNIKATTTEGLGFTGRSEGIAAQAVVSVKL